MLNSEQKLFIEIMKCNVNGTTIKNIPDDIDWNLMLSIAKKQEMSAILSFQLSGYISKNDKLTAISNEICTLYASTLFVYQKRLAVLQKIDKEFSKEKIEYIIFKGTEISNLYNNPALRTMGDSDILVHEKDRDRAHDVLLKLGMKNTCKQDNEWIYYYDNFEFELHCRLMNEDEIGNSESHKDFMNKHWDYANNDEGSVHFHLDWNYHFVFLLLHLRKHLINCGVGFRQFMDLAITINNCSLDWDWIKRQTDKLQITDFLTTCLAFCQKWFDLAVPFDIPELDEDFYINSTQNIFNGGVFGFADSANKENYTILKIKDNVAGQKLKILLKFAFPPIERYKESERYSFLNDRPWLLPVAWVYRLLFSIKHGFFGKETKNIKSKLNVSSSQIEKRINYLNDWGVK